MNENNGIAWMIAGGVRAESREDQRQRRQRGDLAHAVPERGDVLQGLRVRLAEFAGARPVAPANERGLAADCCPA